MVRKATAKDGERVYELICDMEGTLLPWEPFFEIFQKQLAGSSHLCLVEEEAGRVIGALNLRFEEQLHHGALIAEVMEFAVDPGCRGRGVGKGMLARACQVAKERGVCADRGGLQPAAGRHPPVLPAGGDAQFPL